MPQFVASLTIVILMTREISLTIVIFLYYSPLGQCSELLQLLVFSNLLMTILRTVINTRLTLVIVIFVINPNYSL